MQAKFFTFIFISFFFPLAHLSAQVFTGSQANARVKGAEMVLWEANSKAPKFVRFYANQQPSEREIPQLLQVWFPSNQASFQLAQVQHDPLGMKHMRYTQHAFGHPIEDAVFIFHIKDGKVVSANGEFGNFKLGSATFSLTPNDALTKALSYVGAEKYMWQQPGANLQLKAMLLDTGATYYPKPVLTWCKNPLSIDGSYVLCYSMDVYALNPLSRQRLFVHAITGDIVMTKDLLHTGDSKGSAKTYYSGTQDVTTDSTGPGSFRLREKGRGKGIFTYNLERGTDYNVAVDFTDADNYWNNVNNNKDQVAGDAHWGAEMTYDFYKDKLGRNSVDDNGYPLNSYVHYSTGYDNAFWDGYQMTYGDGSVLSPLTALDVCGHEVSHGVTQYTSNLNYQGESGALNESFSDIFGTSIEFYGRPNRANYLIGEDVISGGLRSMKNPGAFNDPAEYGDPNWYTGSADNGGVHTNSGVQNRWFYVLSAGASGTTFNGRNFNVTGIGIESAAKIAYRSNAFYLTANSQYADARFYAIESANDLFGKCSNEVIQTTNAWYAVNIGDAYDTILTSNFTTDYVNGCTTPFTVNFTHASASASSFTWDFGDGTTSTTPNPSHTYTTQGKYTVKLKVLDCTGTTSDSTTKVDYIVIDPNSKYCKSVKMPTSGSLTQTDCEGVLKDDGGDANYTDMVDAYVVIQPTNAAFIKIHFTSFDFENNYDYLYIYDGPSTSSPLIGKFTGSSLPKDIISSGGAITIQQETDPFVEGTGFEMEWQCYQKVPDDAGIVQIILNDGRANTSSGLSNNQPIKVLLKNYGSNTLKSIPVWYKINGNSQVNETWNGTLNSGDTITFTFAAKADLSASGIYNVHAGSSLASDTQNINDQTSMYVRHLNNDPVKLPYFEDFELVTRASYQSPVFGLDQADRYDYTQSLVGGRMQTQAGTGFPRGGKSAITFDMSPANSSSGPYNINYLYLTLNLSKVSNVNLYLDFSYMSHGDENNANDRIWARGSDKNSWVEIFDLFANAAAAGTYNDVKKVDILTALTNAGQSLTSSFQLRFGQEDNGTANSTTANDGFTFDNIKVYQEVEDISVNQILNPIGGCGLSNAEQIKIEVLNIGKDITNQAIDLIYRFDGNAPVKETVSLSLTTGQTYAHTFASTLDLSAQGNHTLVVYTSWANDKVHANDTMSYAFNSYPAITPVVVNASGPLDFCSGDSVVLSANSGYASYVWSNGKTSQSIVVKSGGSFNVSVFDANGCSDKSGNTVVKVNPKPNPGFNYVISLGTVTFSNLSSNALSYVWDFGDGDTSSQKNPVHTYLNTGNYTVTLKATNGCGEVSFALVIKINALGLSKMSEDYTIQVWPNPTDGMICVSLPSEWKGGNWQILSVDGRILTSHQTIQNEILQTSLAEFAPGVYLIRIGCGDRSRNIKVVRY